MFPPKANGPAGGGLKTVRQNVQRLPPLPDPATDANADAAPAGAVACPSCGAALKLEPAVDQAAPPDTGGQAPPQGGGGPRY